MKPHDATPSSNTPEDQTAQQRLIETFHNLPAEVKFWIRFGNLLLWFGDNSWSGDGFSERIRATVEADEITAGLPTDRPDAEWLAGIAEALDTVQSHH